MTLPLIYLQMPTLDDTHDFYYVELKKLATVFSWLPVIQILFVAFFILIRAVFRPTSAQLSRLIYRVTSFSLFIILLTSVYDVVPRFVKTRSYFVWGPKNVKYFESYLREYQQSICAEHGLPHDPFAPDAAYSELNASYTLADPLYSHFFLFFGLRVVLLFVYSISHGRSVWPLAEVEFPILVLLLSATSLALLHVERLIDLVRLLEIATLGTYVLVGYERINRFSALAAVQYLIIGTLPSAALILAVALIYQGWGGFTFHELDLLVSTAASIPELPVEPYITKSYDPAFVNSASTALEYSQYNSSINKLITTSYFVIAQDIAPIIPYGVLGSDIGPLTQAYEYIPVLAAILVRFNLLFKLTAAPFHFWAPSVYGNAPLASVTFVSILSKVFVLALVAKLFWTFFHSLQLVLVPLLFLVAILSAFAGTLGAIIEQRTKRFYVYSSMGHVGFMLAGVSFLYLSGLSAQFHYLAIYILTSYARWFFLLILGPSATHLVHFSRLKDYPELGMFLTFLLFSRSGLPPLAGFYVKLDIFITLLEGSRFYTAYALYFLSVVSFFYYLRLIKIFFFDSNEIALSSDWVVVKPKSLLWLLSFLTLGILLYGIFVERSLLLTQREFLSALL